MSSEVIVVSVLTESTDSDVLSFCDCSTEAVSFPQDVNPTIANKAINYLIFLKFKFLLLSYKDTKTFLNLPPFYFKIFTCFLIFCVWVNELCYF